MVVALKINTRKQVHEKCRVHIVVTLIGRYVRHQWSHTRHQEKISPRSHSKAILRGQQETYF